MDLNFSIGFLNCLLQNPILPSGVASNDELENLTQGMSSSKIGKMVIFK